MDCTCVYGHNIYIDNQLVGYISSDSDGNALLYVSGHLFARMTSDGSITINGEEVGYVDDGGDIYLHDKLVGEVDPQNDFRFKGARLNGD
jgi:hypothetical protein